MSYRSEISLAAMFTLACLVSTRAELRPGDPMPTLESAVVPGQGIPSTEGRVVLLDFWASWCAPCKASFPMFARLHTEYSERGLVIIAVGVDETTSAHEAFLRKLDPPFHTFRDRDRKIVQTVQVPAMPTSYLFGRDGRLRFIHTGYHGKSTEAALRDQLEALLVE